MSTSWRFKLLHTLQLSLSVSLLPAVAIATTGGSFTSPEHVKIGNDIKLYFSSNQPAQAGYTLHLPNGLSLTYGDLVSMPDFYGVPAHAVSKGSSESQRRLYFLEAFNALATNPASTIEANKIMSAIRSEQKVVDEGMEHGEQPEDVYVKIGHEFDRQYNCITGGGCDIDTWWLEPGRYLNLVNDNSNYDHFGDNAVITYKVGHQLALEQAVFAHETNDLKKLEMAYALNAFACHFLTDRFASGHIRTPRIELSEHTVPATAGALLANYMHNEENLYGLHVHNLKGYHWVAYGDQSYFSDKTETHKKILLETMQNSANAIFEAYKQGTTKVNDDAIDFIPQPDETASTSNLDISPLFYWDTNSSTLMRRSDTANYYDRHWTADWWGWSTLIKLKNERGLTVEDQAILARSKQRKQAVRNGLITNKKFIEYVKTH